MKKISILLAAFALVLGVGVIRANAEEGAVAVPTRVKVEAVRAKVAEVQKEAREDRVETRADMKAVSTNSTDDKKTIIRSYAERVVGRLGKAIEIMTENADRIATRITKIETEKGITMTDAKAKLAEARTALTNAKTAVDGVMAQVDTALASATPRDAFKTVRGVIETANQSVKTAHKALVETLRLVKVELGKNKPVAAPVAPVAPVQ